ncbi:hypothetical protein PFLG_02038 [Plasmodium falciparum RAJ116]|uniref:Uncharacterized protein n=1 Tax=Plasmodium falciparum RAJ116 TaxID=580058 RepID=A0A0L0D0Y2_PLAFA|nr:hypothetical protein PFLG_02038 [Plasmodium falciparum RAJ116]
MKEKYVLIKKILNKNNDIISNDTTVSCCDNILCTSSCSSLDEKCDEEEINKYDDFLKGKKKKWDIRTHGSLYKKWSCNKNDDKDMWIHRMNFHKHPNHIVKKKKHDYNKEHKSAYCKNGDDVNDEEYLKRMTKNIENYIRKMKDMIYYKRQIKKTKKRKEKKRKEKKIKEKKRKKKIKRSVNIKSICNDNNIKEINNINDYNIHHYKKDIQKLYEHLNYEQNNLSTSLLENHYINKNETDHNLFWTCCSEENLEKPREMVFQKNCDLKKKSNEIFISHTQNTFPYNNNLSCICCARIYLIDKIIKVTSNKIKPLCICCFDILLNLIGINTIICISCFKCYFPFEFVNKCVICNSFDMINLKKEDKL